MSTEIRDQQALTQQLPRSACALLRANHCKEEWLRGLEQILGEIYVVSTELQNGWGRKGHLEIT